jgi:hypothetical protein
MNEFKWSSKYRCVASPAFYSCILHKFLAAHLAFRSRFCRTIRTWDGTYLLMRISCYSCVYLSIHAYISCCDSRSIGVDVRYALWLISKVQSINSTVY